MKAIVIYNSTFCSVIEFKPFFPYYKNVERIERAFSKWHYKQDLALKPGEEFPEEYEGKYQDAIGVVYWMNLVSKKANAKVIKDGDVEWVVAPLEDQPFGHLEGVCRYPKRYNPKFLNISEEDAKLPVIDLR